MLLQCHNCGFYTNYNPSFCTVLVCERCSERINIISEDHGTKVNLDQEENNQLLPIGTVVKITNKQHVWFDDIAIICELKHKFYRLELHGAKIWVPYEWVQNHEPVYND